MLEHLNADCSGRITPLAKIVYWLSINGLLSTRLAVHWVYHLEANHDRFDTKNCAFCWADKLPKKPLDK